MKNESDNKPSDNPKSSINKLGEFVYASHAKQWTIVKDQAAKRPPGVKTYRYNEARAATSRYFIEGFNVSIIDQAIEDLGKKQVYNDHDKIEQKTSIESLTNLKEIDLSMFNGYKFERFAGDGSIEIGGIRVSVFPDLIFRTEIKKKKVIGAIKVHIGKSGPLKAKPQAAVAVMLNRFIDQKVKAEDEIALHKIIYSIDVFSQSVHAAPKAQTQLFNEIEAACETYKLIWRSIKEPLT